jgi:hypothetical protein
MTVHKQIAKLACKVAAAAAVAFAMALFFAAFMVGGDGTAPLFSHVMLAMAMVPESVFGAPREVGILSSPVLWGLVVAVCTYLLIQLMRVIYRFFQAAL